MSFFNEDDPFDSIVREFFENGSRNNYRKRTFINNEEDERVIDFIETSDCVYLIFELPGFSEEDTNVKVEGKYVNIIVKKKEIESVKEYLAQKLSAGIKYRKSLPDFINPKGFNYYLKNGILEIVFKKRSKEWLKIKFISV